MATLLSSLLRNAMITSRMDRKELVQAMGYSNLTKGLRRLDAWLSGDEMPTLEQVEVLSNTLHRSQTEILQAIAKDREAMKDAERQARRENPNYRVSIRAIPGVIATFELPGTMSIEQAIQIAKERAHGLCRFAVNTPENQTYWCSAEGRLEALTDGAEPTMRVGGKPFRFSEELD